jgi:uncharacterized protein
MAVLFVLLLSGNAQAPEIPTLYLYVNDLTEPAALLSYEYSSLEDLCFEVDYLTTAEIAIVIVNTTQPQGIDLFAVETFEANEIGKAGKDNGVMILVSTDERAWRVEVGYGLEGILPDAKVGRIGVDTLAPALAVGDFYGGLYDATLAIGQEIVDNYDGSGGQTPNVWVIDWGYVALIVAVAAGTLLLTKGRSALFLGLGGLFRRGGFGGGRSGGGGARGRY